MKILINTGRFNGGAPLSILEYAKIAKKNGHNVIAVGEYSTSQKLYMEYGIKTYNIKYFATKRLINNLVGLKQFIQIINYEKPDIIHATSYGIVPSKFVAMLFKIPIVFSVAGGKVSNNCFSDENLIVYSLENKNDLINFGVNENKIDVISNRMNFDNLNIITDDIYKEAANQVNLLLISRLDEGVIKSVINVMNITKHLAGLFDNLTLTIIGDGQLYKMVLNKAEEINAYTGKDTIKIMGFVESPREYIINSHLVFGKGRSIIEAILNNRISFVIGENDDVSVCSTESVENLYEYNFSGRNIKHNISIDQIARTISIVMKGSYNVKDLQNIREHVDKYYNIKHVEKYILHLYENIVNDKKYIITSNRIKAFQFLTKYYYTEILNFNKWNKKMSYYKNKYKI